VVKRSIKDLAFNGGCRMKSALWISLIVGVGWFLLRILSDVIAFKKISSTILKVLRFAKINPDYSGGWMPSRILIEKTIMEIKRSEMGFSDALKRGDAEYKQNIIERMQRIINGMVIRERLEVANLQSLPLTEIKIVKIYRLKEHGGIKNETI
jgi:hypothetical protein